MSRKLYYNIISVVLIAIPLYYLLTWILRSNFNIELYSKLGFVKLLLAIYIAYFETRKLKNYIQILNSILFFTAIVGYLFAVMHWPGGRQIFLGTSFSIVLILLIISLRNNKDNWLTLLVLLYPLIYLVYALGKIYHVPILWFFDYIAMLLLAFSIIVKSKKLYS